MGNEIKNNAWLKFDDARKTRKFFIFVKDIRNIYQIVKTERESITRSY